MRSMPWPRLPTYRRCEGTRGFALVSFEELNELMGLPAINALEQQFVTKS